MFQMRIQDKSTFLISEDNVSDPQNILFKEVLDVVDTTSVTEVRNASETFPVGVNVISLGNIAAGKLIYVKPTAACVMTIGGETISLRAGKVSKIWADFTTLTITVSTASNKIALVIAGD